MAGQLSLVEESVDVAELLADIQTSFSGQAEAAGVELVVDIERNGEGEAKALTLAGDEGRLDQLLSNLIVNALRHTPAGGRIELRAARHDGGVRLTVDDTGEGIAADDLPYIFDRFWRGDRARSHGDGSGGGLGLAIAKQLVQAHGGQIEAASELGRGTTFVIELHN